MKLKSKFLQQGGAMPADPMADQAAAPMGPEAPGANPEEELIQMAVEIVQTLGPEGALMLAEAIAMVVQESSQPQEAPVYAKKGGKLVKIK